MNSNSENSSNLSDSDFDPPSDTEFPIDFEDEEIPTPSSLEPYLSFVLKTYPLSFFYDYDSVKLKEYSNRILLPMYILDKITKDDRVKFPLFFYIKVNEKRHYFSVENFPIGIDDCFIPNHIFEQMGIEYGEYQEIMIDFETLPKGSSLILEPHDKEFLKVPNPKTYLETHLVRSYPCLTEGSVIRIIYGKNFLDFNVKQTKPEKYISCLETEIEVDFEKPLNYVEPPKPTEKKKKEYIPKKEGFVSFSGKGNRLGGN